MAEEVITLAELYQGWDRYQDLLVQTVTPLTEEQLAWRAAPHLRSAGELLGHIIACRAGWFYYVLQEREEELVDLSKWGNKDTPARSASELVSGLQTTWQVIANRLACWTLADLEAVFQDKEDDGTVVNHTRQWVLWHLLEHDIHHGGEFSFVLGLHGREGMDI